MQSLFKALLRAWRRRQVQNRGFERGFQAARHGIKRCPYTLDRRARAAWMQGADTERQIHAIVAKSES